METFVLFLILTAENQETDWLFGGVFSTVDEAIKHYEHIWKSADIFYKIFKEQLDNPAHAANPPVATNWSYEKQMVIYADRSLSTASA